MRVGVGLVFIWGVFLATQASADETEVNLLSWDQAAVVAGTPPSDHDWPPDQMLDELPDTGWANPRSDLTPKDIVVELGTKSRVTRFVFDTAHAYSRERSAKAVVVSIAEAKAGPFTQVAKVTLAAAKDGQAFPLATPAVGRYLKLTVVNNYGDTQFMEVMNWKAYGKPLQPMKTPQVSGTYSSTIENVHIQQRGNAASGCYDHNLGLIQNGGFEGRVLRVAWSTDAGGGTRNTGTALLIFAEDGQSFIGHWWKPNSVPMPWDGKRISSDIGSCSNWKPDGNHIEQQLALEGRVRLYGILFDTDSDHIKPESKGTLDALVDAAKKQPTWSFGIEGHTDNVGSDAHNQELSTKRALAVKTYLAAAGIAATRLSTQGFASTKPVASNDTSSGRAQNRRVEIVKK